MSVRQIASRNASLLRSSKVTVGDLGVSGQGFAFCFFYRMFASYSGASDNALIGAALNDTTGFLASAAQTSGFGIKGSTQVGQSRISRASTSSTIAWLANPQPLALADGFPALVAGTNWFICSGIRNIGTVETPDWRTFAAMSEVGAPLTAMLWDGHTPVDAVVDNDKAVFDRVFTHLGGAGNARALDGQALDNVAVLRGDVTLADVQAWADGTDDYSRAGFDMLAWYRLRDRDDVADRSPLAGPALTPNGFTIDDIVANAADIAPAIFFSSGGKSITITEPPAENEVFGGRGGATFTFAGTSTGLTGVERRWVNADTSTPLAGALGEWTATTYDDGDWSFSSQLPWSGSGNTRYRLQLRGASPDAEITEQTSPFLIGTHIVQFGQSGQQDLWGGVDNFDTNKRSLACVAGVRGWLAGVNNQFATTGDPGSYVQPVAVSRTLTGGATPACSQSVVEAVNRWHLAGQGPMRMSFTAVGGSGVSEFNSDTLTWGSRKPLASLWPYRGTATAPGVSDAGTSGLHGYMALLAKRAADIVVLAWVPGVGDEQGLRDAWPLMDALYNAAPAPIKLMSPAFRGGRTAADLSQTIAIRIAPQVVALERDAILGAGAADAQLAFACPDHGIRRDGNQLHHDNGATADMDNVNLGLRSTRDQDGIGPSRHAITLIQQAISVYDPTERRWGARDLAAWFRTARTQIVLETGVLLYTGDGRVPDKRQFSLKIGSDPWVHGPSDVTAAIEGTKVILTRSTAWPAGEVRVAVQRGPYWPNDGELDNSEALVFDQMLGYVYTGPRERLGYPDPDDWAGWPLATANYDGLLVADNPPALAVRLAHPIDPSILGTRQVRIRAFSVSEGINGDIVATANVSITAP